MSVERSTTLHCGCQIFHSVKLGRRQYIDSFLATLNPTHSHGHYILSFVLFVTSHADISAGSKSTLCGSFLTFKLNFTTNICGPGLKSFRRL